VRELFHRPELQTLRKVADQLAVGPIRGQYAPPQISQQGIAKMDMKGSDLAGTIYNAFARSWPLLGLTGCAYYGERARQNGLHNYVRLHGDFF
jgi:hypothetical protein